MLKEGGIQYCTVVELFCIFLPLNKLLINICVFKDFD